MSLDILIKGAEVVDGTGARAYRADVGLRGDRIVDVGNLAGARGGRIIEAQGKIICPGFIDIHSHNDLQIY